MDKKGFREYVSILKEIEENENRIQQMQKEIDAMTPRNAEVTDSVTRGKRGKKPLGTVTIHGMQDAGLINRKRSQLYRRKARKHALLAKLNNQIATVEEYIDSLKEGSELRRLLTYRCIEGVSRWEEVAERMGEGYTAESCKQKFSRFMRN